MCSHRDEPREKYAVCRPGLNHGPVRINSTLSMLSVHTLMPLAPLSPGGPVAPYKFDRTEQLNLSHSVLLFRQ